jgi:sporulation protein YlmC with PRC-barrel domain
MRGRDPFGAPIRKRVFRTRDERGEEMTIRTILMAGVAGTVLAAAPLAVAQQSTPQNQPATPPASSTMPSSPSTANAPSPNAMQVDKLVGKSVRNNNGEKIGDIEAVYVTPSGQVDSVIVGVGGFLGMGEREVAVKWSDLKVSPDGDTITSNMTKDSLKALPEYTYKDKSYRGRVFSDTGIYGTDRRADTRTPGGTTTRDNTSTTADTGRPATTAPGSSSVRDNTPATAPNTRTDRPVVGSPADRTAPADRPARSAATTKGFTKTGEMSADALIGATVKNKAGETVGEIKDLHLNKDGSIKAAVVGVGGFLGMGERNVLIPWNQIQTARENDADLVVRTEASKDSLKAMPEYEM